MMERRRSNRLEICIARSNRGGLLHLLGFCRRESVVGWCFGIEVLDMELDHGGEGIGRRREPRAPRNLRSRRTFDSSRCGAT